MKANVEFLFSMIILIGVSQQATAQSGSIIWVNPTDQEQISIGTEVYCDGEASFTLPQTATESHTFEFIITVKDEWGVVVGYDQSLVELSPGNSVESVYSGVVLDADYGGDLDVGVYTVTGKLSVIPSADIPGTWTVLDSETNTFWISDEI